MRIKRKTKSSTTPIDQFLTKDAKPEADAVPSTSGGSADVNSKVKELNGSNKTEEEVPKQNNKENKGKVPKKAAEKASEEETPAMKKLQIQLKRCDDGSKEEEETEVHAGSDADAGTGANQDDESKQKSKTRGRRQKSNPRETSKRKNSTSDQSDDAQKSDFESGGSSNGAGQSDEVKTSRARGKRLRKNSTEGKSKKMVDIPEEAENAQSEENGDAPEKLQEAEDAEESETVPDQAQKGAKRKRGGKDKGDGDAKPSKSVKQEKDTNKSKTSRDKIPDVTALDFSNDSKSPSGKKWNFKISSWNINGIRAWIEKNGLSYLHHEKPDIICIQETKCSDDKMPEDMKEVEGYHSYWLAGDKDGYSGVGILSKQEPIKVEYGIGISEHDNEGRVITAEYEKFYLVAAYVPNAGRKLVRLEYRMKWDKDFRAYLKKLDAEKPVILCGDLNVAHEEIDLANPKTNKKNAGFTKEEREGFSSLLEEGFTDTFRHLYPDATGAYTFWTYMMNARAKDVGWRLDYFVVSKRFCENVCDSVIRKEVLGSDHCPVTLFLSL